MNLKNHKQTLSKRASSARQKDASQPKKRKPCEGCGVLTTWYKMFSVSGCQDCNRAAKNPLLYTIAMAMEAFETVRKNQTKVLERINKLDLDNLETQQFFRTTATTFQQHQIALELLETLIPKRKKKPSLVTP